MGARPTALVLTVSEDLDCSGMPDLGQEICSYDEGFIAALLEKFTGKTPKFPLAERLYFLNAVRYVSHVIEAAPQTHPDALPCDVRPDLWVDEPTLTNAARQKFAVQKGITYRVLTEPELAGFPAPPPMPSAPGRRKVVATGCYDWFHSGHVRFTEEASAYGDLYVCLGSDKNVELLKGKGHPLLCEQERRYVVGSIKYVKQALITTGSGWVDADPEIRRLKPDIYVVNEDGDKGGKREYCQPCFQSGTARSKVHRAKAKAARVGESLA